MSDRFVDELIAQRDALAARLAAECDEVELKQACIVGMRAQAAALAARLAEAERKIAA